jgi:hypothetical protein
MTVSAVRQRSVPPLAPRSVSTPNPTTSPATGTSAGSRSPCGPSRHRADGRTPIAPPTSLGDQSSGAQISAARERPSRWAPYGSGSTADPLGQGEPSDVSLSPQSCCAPPLAAGATTILQRHGAATTRTTPTCCSSRPRRWRHRRSTTARVTNSHRRRRPAPPPSVSCCGHHCDRTWRSGVSCVAPYAQRASYPPPPGSG